MFGTNIIFKLNINWVPTWNDCLKVNAVPISEVQDSIILVSVVSGARSSPSVAGPNIRRGHVRYVARGPSSFVAGRSASRRAQPLAATPVYRG